MNIAEIFIRRPVMTTLVMIGLLLFGVMGYRLLPIRDLPLTAPTLPLSELDEYGETMMAQRISTVSGVAQVQVYGPQKYAVRVQLDPRALASRGIGINEVQQAVAGANVNLPTGILY